MCRKPKNPAGGDFLINVRDQALTMQNDIDEKDQSNDNDDVSPDRPACRE